MVGTDLKPGDTIEFIGYPEFGLGTIKEHCPDHGGYMVRPDGYPRAGGFGYGELKLPELKPVLKLRPRTRYEMLQDGGDPV